MNKRFCTFIVNTWVDGIKVQNYLKYSYGPEPKQIQTLTQAANEFTPYAQLAGWVDPDDVELVVKIYQKLIDRHGEECVQLVDVKIDITHTTVPVDSGDILEERRRVAFNKLRPDEYKVLGIEQLGVYHKLKYHKDE